MKSSVVVFAQVCNLYFQLFLSIVYASSSDELIHDLHIECISCSS